MKHPKYKQIIRLINLSTEHGIFQQKVNRFKYGFLLLSYWLERSVDPEIVKAIKKQFNKETTNQIRFNELINIFYFRIINAVVMVIIFLIELMYFFINKKVFKIHCNPLKQFQTQTSAHLYLRLPNLDSGHSGYLPF